MEKTALDHLKDNFCNNQTFNIHEENSVRSFKR